MRTFDEIYKETKGVSSKMNAIKDMSSPEYDELFKKFIALAEESVEAVKAETKEKTNGIH